MRIRVPKPRFDKALVRQWKRGHELANALDWEIERRKTFAERVVELSRLIAWAQTLPVSRRAVRLRERQRRDLCERWNRYRKAKLGTRKR
jgi:hypothetical protein